METTSSYVRWAAIGCLPLLPALAAGHEINFDGKTLVEIRQGCVGNLTADGPGEEMVVDEEDVTILIEEHFGSDCSEGCVADWNHTHVVGDGDLRLLLGNWGPCRDHADVNGDGDVDLDDAAEVVDDLDLDCRPDLDFSGLVEGNDFNLAQLAWGPGDDHQGDVDRDGVLEIGDDLLAVVNALGRVCTSDVDLDGTVDCQDLEDVCEAGGIDCCGIGAAVCPDLPCSP